MLFVVHLGGVGIGASSLQFRLGFVPVSGGVFTGAAHILSLIQRSFFVDARTSLRVCVCVWDGVLSKRSSDYLFKPCRSGAHG